MIMIAVVVVALSSTRSGDDLGLSGGLFRCVFARLGHGPLPNMITTENFKIMKQ